MKNRNILIAFGFVLLAIILIFVGFLMIKQMEVQNDEMVCPTQPDIHCDCNVSVDCCCPTETPTPTETSGYVPPLARTVEPTGSPTTVSSPTSTSVSDATSTPAPKRTATSPAPTKSHTSTATAPTVPTPTVPRPTEKPTVTPRQTATVEACECVWICWNFNKNYWKNYCCPLGNNSCVQSHMKQGDSYMNRCRNNEETHPDDGYCLP